MGLSNEILVFTFKAVLFGFFFRGRKIFSTMETSTE